MPCVRPGDGAKWHCIPYICAFVQLTTDVSPLSCSYQTRVMVLLSMRLHVCETPSVTGPNAPRALLRHRAEHINAWHMFTA